jgi:uncharacterized glyoxalase superfamily protein PhnB
MSVKPIPDGYHSVTPYLMVPPGSKLLEFLVQAFAARVHRVVKTPSGGIQHAEVEIGDSRIMFAEACNEWKPMPTSLYLYVPDCDSTYQRALAAGAKSLTEPTLTFYGDRSGGVIDPAGNMWYISTCVEEITDEELQRRIATMNGTA